MQMLLACCVSYIGCLGREFLLCRGGAWWCHWEAVKVGWGARSCLEGALEVSRGCHGGSLGVSFGALDVPWKCLGVSSG